MKKSRKAQVTLFIILGIIIVGGIFAYIGIKDNNPPSESQTTRAPAIPEYTTTQEFIPVSESTTAKASVPPQNFPEKELAFENISRGFSSGHDGRKDYVIKDNSEWSNLWDIVNSIRRPLPALPVADFNNEMIIAVFQGAHSTGGYSTEITRIIEKDSSIEVFVKETSPSPGDMVAQVFTQPYHIVKIKKTDKQVLFLR